MDKELILELLSISSFNIPINISKDDKAFLEEKLNKKTETPISNTITNKFSSFDTQLRSIKNAVPLHWRTEDELVKRITAIIEKIAKENVGLSLCQGYDKFDIKKISKLIVSKRLHEIGKAKFSKQAKHVEFFIDTSMSMNEYKTAIATAIKILERDGFVCYIRGCGNGFSDRDRENDQYNVRYTLESIGAGIVPTICRPTEKTASKLVNEAEFSVIISDFDGLSSIVRMSKLWKKDKIPYLLSTENRYSWKNTTAHVWVEKDNSMYEPSKVFDIAKKKRL